MSDIFSGEFANIVDEHVKYAKDKNIHIIGNCCFTRPVTLDELVIIANHMMASGIFKLSNDIQDKFINYKPLDLLDIFNPIFTEIFSLTIGYTQLMLSPDEFEESKDMNMTTFNFGDVYSINGNCGLLNLLRSNIDNVFRVASFHLIQIMYGQFSNAIKSIFDEVEIDLDKFQFIRTLRQFQYETFTENNSSLPSPVVLAPHVGLGSLKNGNHLKIGTINKNISEDSQELLSGLEKQINFTNMMIDKWTPEFVCSFIENFSIEFNLFPRSYSHLKSKYGFKCELIDDEGIDFIFR